MGEDTKKFVKYLRHCGSNSGGNPDYCDSCESKYAYPGPMGLECIDGLLLHAADLIEQQAEISERCASAKHWRARALELRVDRDAWKHRAEAAERDMAEMAKSKECVVCKHRFDCDVYEWPENNCFEWRGPVGEGETK